MSHGIELTDGRANMAYTGRTPWHSLGQNIEGAFDAETALREANLDWEVEVAPLYYETLENLDESGSKQYIKHVKSDKGQIVRRVDTGDELGVVGPKYSPLQNKDAFAFFDGVFGEGKARYETAGYLGKGERMWLLANMTDNDPIEILPGDEINKYLLLTNDFTGNYSVIGSFTPVRVVCNNTLTAAVKDIIKGGNTVRVKHVGDVANRLNFAGEVLSAAGVFYDEVKDLFQSFARKQLNGEQTRNFIHHSLFDDNKETKSRTKKVDMVEGLMHTGRGSDIKGVRGTVWGAYNAVTEYVDHVKEYRGGAAKKLEASQFGTGRYLKTKALRLGAEMVSYGKEIELN
jgi:phage/plasmid-like protein (TIGR03299 family)